MPSLPTPNGSTIFNNNASYNEGPYSLTYAGTYTLTVYSSGTSRATGNYSFAVDDVTAPASSIALTSGAGTTVSGTLASGLAANFYQFSGTAGERLYFESLSESPAYSSYVTSSTSQMVPSHRTMRTTTIRGRCHPPAPISCT